MILSEAIYVREIEEPPIIITFSLKYKNMPQKITGEKKGKKESWARSKTWIHNRKEML